MPFFKKKVAKKCLFLLHQMLPTYSRLVPLGNYSLPLAKGFEIQQKKGELQNFDFRVAYLKRGCF